MLNNFNLQQQNTDFNLSLNPTKAHITLKKQASDYDEGNERIDTEYAPYE